MAGWRRSRRNRRSRFWMTLLVALLVAAPLLVVGVLLLQPD